MFGYKFATNQYISKCLKILSLNNKIYSSFTLAWLITNDFQVEFFSFNRRKQWKLSVCKKSLTKLEWTDYKGAFPLSKYRENRLVKTKKIDRITWPIPKTVIKAFMYNPLNLKKILLQTINLHTKGFNIAAKRFDIANALTTV